MLIGLKATHRLSDVIRDIKSNSSNWAKNELNVRLFSWQDGYAAFTVSRSMIERVKKYIADQEEHHKRLNFKDEYLEFLKLHNVEYDENICGEFRRPFRADKIYYPYRGLSPTANFLDRYRDQKAILPLSYSSVLFH